MGQRRREPDPAWTNRGGALTPTGGAIVSNPTAPTPPHSGDDFEAAARRMEDNYDAFTASKTDNLAGPLKVAGIPYKNPHLGSKGFGMGGSAA